MTVTALLCWVLAQFAPMNAELTVDRECTGVQRDGACVEGQRPSPPPPPPPSPSMPEAPFGRDRISNGF